MSAPPPSTSTTVHVGSPENISNTGNSFAIPVVIAASIISVALFLSLVWVVFYLVRRRRPLQTSFDQQESTCYQFDKDNYLPPEPSPPPPPYKDSGDEPDLELGMKPLLPPKDVGRPFVRTKRTVQRWSFMSETPTSEADSLPVTPPERALIKD